MEAFAAVLLGACAVCELAVVGERLDGNLTDSSWGVLLIPAYVAAVVMALGSFALGQASRVVFGLVGAVSLLVYAIVLAMRLDGTIDTWWVLVNVPLWVAIYSPLLQSLEAQERARKLMQLKESEASAAVASLPDLTLLLVGLAVAAAALRADAGLDWGWGLVLSPLWFQALSVAAAGASLLLGPWKDDPHSGQAETVLGFTLTGSVPLFIFDLLLWLQLEGTIDTSWHVVFLPWYIVVGVTCCGACIGGMCSGGD